MSDTVKLYTVHDLVMLTGITRKTLFYYDHIDLLKPDQRTGTQQNKLYTEESYQKLLKVLKYRQAGIHINEIKQILVMNEEDRELFLHSVICRIEEEIRNHKKHIALIKEMLMKQ